MATATKERASAATATKKKQQHETDTPPKPPAPPPRTLAPPPSLPNLDRLRSLVAAFAPVLRLHPDDAFNPCSAEWFASRCSLWDDGGGEKKCLAGLGECSLRLAVEKQRELIKQGGAGGRRRIRLQLDPLARGGQRFEELDERVPLYVRAHLVVPPPPPPPACCGEEVSLRPRLEITYLALYAYNGPYYPFSETFGPGLGAHDGDLERVTVRLDAETGELVGCFFSAHRPRDGGWAAASEIERFEPSLSSSSSSSSSSSTSSSSSSFSARGRIVAFVAKHGHGTYPTAGTQLRAGFLANDRTSARGKAWAPRRLVLLRASGAAPPPPPTTTTTKDAGDPKPKSSPSPRPPLSPVAALLESPELGVTVCRGCELETPSSSSSSWTMPPPPSDPRATGVVVEAGTQEAELFGEFEGNFGEVLAARSQGWWDRAECPVSRGLALRVGLQWWPERESLHRR